MHTITYEFGKRLRALRQARHLSQVELAEKLGMDRSFLCDVEQGKKSMSLPYLKAIADGFEMKLDELVSGL